MIDSYNNNIYMTNRFGDRVSPKILKTENTHRNIIFFFIFSTLKLNQRIFNEIVNILFFGLFASVSNVRTLLKLTFISA